MCDWIEVSFSSWEYRRFAPEIESYTDTLLQKVIPIFDDVDAEQERAANAVLEWPGWGEDDYDRAMEAAYDAGIDHALRFMELRSVFLATAVSGLFHLFEKQIYKHINRELEDWLVEPINRWQDIESLIRKLTYKIQKNWEPSQELYKAFFDPSLTELRLVVNAVKHGEGHSLAQLNRISAAVVSEDRVGEDWTVGPFSILGVKLAILPEDIERYRDVILRFWRIEGTFGAPLDAFITTQAK